MNGEFSFVREGYNPSTDSFDGWHRPEDALPMITAESISGDRYTAPVLVAVTTRVGGDPEVLIAYRVKPDEHEPYWLRHDSDESWGDNVFAWRPLPKAPRKDVVGRGTSVAKRPESGDPVVQEWWESSFLSRAK